MEVNGHQAISWASLRVARKNDGMRHCMGYLESIPTGSTTRSPGEDKYLVGAGLLAGDYFAAEQPSVVSAASVTLPGPTDEFFRVDNLEDAVVWQDLADIKTGVAFEPCGQKRHFMRAESGEEMDSSWKESLEWIKLHASQAANAMSNDLTGVSVSPRADRRRSRFSQGTMRLLGTALHALQDSFAPAHTERGSAQTSGDPGPIVWIHVYDDANQTRHNEMDLEWNGHRSGPRSQSDPTADFSFNAVCATNASMELIKLVIQSALEPGVRAGNVSLDSSQWRSFAGRWLNLGRPSKPDWIKTAEKTIEKGRADLRRDAEERIKALQKGGGYRPW